MRRGGRLPERLTARDLAGRLKLTFAVHRDSLSLVVMFCNLSQGGGTPIDAVVRAVTVVKKS